MWKFTIDSTTKRVTGFDREPTEGETLCFLPPIQCAFLNITHTRYQYIDGTLSEVPTWPAEQAELARLQAFESLKARIVEKRRAKNAANFPYLGVQYVSDEPNILGVKSQIEILADDAAIPTFTGTALDSTWATAEGTFTPFNCGGFRLFASHYYSHREKNFTNYTLLTIAATQAYMAGATSEELNNFDISSGWD